MYIAAMSKPTKVAAPAAALEPWPIPPAQIRSGDPRASGTLLHDGPEGTGTGVWECTPGSFDWVYRSHQSLCVLKGEAEVVLQSGERYTLGPGDTLFLPRGARASWTVRSTLRKVYTTYQ